ncbi:MAG: class I SAM-dependent methyltransferase [Alphaproteobacteria bacterium]|nr:MAG: class I SAM-dependent methyltransferase [Alphaproteobacteria bacterium]
MNATSLSETEERAAAPAARACPLCAARDAEPLPRYSRDGWQIGRCRGCGFVYLTNPPASEALEEEYAWESSFAEEAGRRLKAAPALYGLDYATRLRTRLFRRDEMAKYRRWFGDGGAVLDIGCGDGSRLAAPFTPCGIEISRRLAAEADARMRALGGYCLQGATLEVIGRFPEAHFDGIVMRSYLEHEPQALPVLEGAHRVLKPGGAIYVKVPNFGSVNRRLIGRNWCGFRHPDHVNYFTLDSLREIARRAGLRLSLVNPLNLPFDDNIHALLRPI